MLVVAERDRIQAAFRRVAAHQFAEAVFGKHLIDRTQPVGAFRMSWRRGMLETCRMTKKQRCHAIPWRAGCALRGGANLGDRRPLGKSLPRQGPCPADWPGP